MLECIKCGTELKFDETVEIQVDASEAVLKELGHCPKCGKKYKWLDVYVYSDFINLEER